MFLLFAEIEGGRERRGMKTNRRLRNVCLHFHQCWNILNLYGVGLQKLKKNKKGFKCIFSQFKPSFKVSFFSVARRSL